MVDYLLTSIDEFERDIERDILDNEDSKKKICTKRKSTHRQKGYIKK